MKKEIRLKIPERTKLKLWVKSAGRCEFKGCNKPVWQNNLTLSDGNFAEVAHIIGSSKDGPRGSDKSKYLQVEFSNLMLLCQPCHKEVDDYPEKYPADLLTKWKEDHENRIEIQTSHPEEIHRSTMLLCSINIGERFTPINYEAARNAMFPKYPIDEKGIKIDSSTFDREGAETEWQTFAEKCIKNKLQRFLEKGINDVDVKHVSIFAIAPMPLLIYLGKCLGDTIPCDIYQSHRNIEDTSKTWNWQKEASFDTSFRVNYIKQTNGNIVILKLSISDSISEDKYATVLSDNISVYEVTVQTPSPHFLKSKKQLELFSYEYRKLLNEIQAHHGKNCTVLILPALPISLAIECGRVILPNKDPNIFVCEYFKEIGGFKKVIKIN